MRKNYPLSLSIYSMTPFEGDECWCYTSLPESSFSTPCFKTFEGCLLHLLLKTINDNLSDKQAILYGMVIGIILAAILVGGYLGLSLIFG